VQPTVEGELLLADARRILEQVAIVEARLSRDAAKGEIRLGVPEEIASGVLARALVRFRQLHPGIRVAVSVGLSRLLRSAVDHDEADMVVLKEVPAMRSSISASPLCWAGALRLTKERILPLAFFPEPCEFRRHVLQLLATANRRCEVVMTSTSCESLRAAARQELALVVLSRPDCPPEIRLEPANAGLPHLPRSGYRFHPAEPKNKAIADLKDLIRTYL
jgi:DNA-binding transcriptional LysR family regulator